ncbi:hypothetical protein RV12_GL000484 [Enterococcus quebecensis]|nr:hypothetical protein RV12_GL000484 [Enterococcus quebecensis]
MNLNVKIQKKGEDTSVINMKKEALEMAPNSMMDFPVPIIR